MTRDTESAGLWCKHDRGGLRLRDQELRHDIDQAPDFWNIVDNDRFILVDNSDKKNVNRYNPILNLSRLSVKRK